MEYSTTPLLSVPRQYILATYSEKSIPSGFDLGQLIWLNFERYIDSTAWCEFISMQLLASEQVSGMFIFQGMRKSPKNTQGLA
jgi:hypothetical protein